MVVNYKNGVKFLYCKGSDLDINKNESQNMKNVFQIIFMILQTLTYPYKRNLNERTTNKNIIIIILENINNNFISNSPKG